MMPSQSDAGLERDLEGYLAWRTAQVARAPDLATMTARVAAGVGMTGRMERTATLRPALIAAVLLLVAVLAVGAAIVASKPSRTATVIPSPTVGLASPTPNLTESFTSAVYGYSIRYPKGWQVTPAVDPWSGIEPVPGGEADVLSPGGQEGMYRELTVVSTPAEGASLEDWATAHALLPKEYKVVGKDAYCFFGALGGTKMTDATVSLTDGEIDGRHALIRGICGHISATVLVDDRIVVLSLFANLQRDGDPATFDAIMETVDFDLPVGAECRRLQAFLKGCGRRCRHGQPLRGRPRRAAGSVDGRARCLARTPRAHRRRRCVGRRVPAR